jgi:hypothetical protein
VEAAARSHSTKQGHAMQSEAEPKAPNPHTGRKAGPNHLSRGPGKTAHLGPASGHHIIWSCGPFLPSLSVTMYNMVIRRVWPAPHHPPRGRRRLFGGGRRRRRGYAACAAPLSSLQPRQPPLRCTRRSVGGASRRGARPLVPGASGARRAPPCRGSPARSAGVRPPPRGPAVCGPAGLRSTLG